MASFWIPLWTAVLLADVSARYAVHHRPVTFDQAVQACSPDTLTTLATEREVALVLRHVTNSSLAVDQNRRTFWVGLRKEKDRCVVPTLPLRGFRWTEDGSEESQVIHWKEEPEHTCTTVRCAVLQVDYDGPADTEGGLISVSCRTQHAFICKLKPKAASAAPEPEPATSEPEPAAPESEPTTPEPEPTTPAPAPAGPEPESATTEPHKPATKRPGPTTPGTKPPTQEPEPDPELKPVSESCQHPIIPGVRALSLDPDDSRRIHVECWSRVQVALRCSGRPAVWRLPDESPANVSAVCQACRADGAPCKHSCLNIDGSFRCVCTDRDGKYHDADSPACADPPTDANGFLLSGVWLWVVVGVAVLVVLVVVVAVTVKCCLMRRSKKRAMKKAEKMAMKSKDGSGKAAI